MGFPRPEYRMGCRFLLQGKLPLLLSLLSVCHHPERPFSLTRGVDLTIPQHPATLGSPAPSSPARLLHDPKQNWFPLLEPLKEKPVLPLLNYLIEPLFS